MATEANIKIDVRVKSWANLLLDIREWWINHLWMPYFVFEWIDLLVSFWGYEKRVNGGEWERM